MNVIAVAGKTGAKTAAIVRWMRLYPGVRTVSFGEFLRRENTRAADLQDFGQHFLEKHGADAIVEGTLREGGQEDCAALIIDGLRHVEVWDVIAKRFPESTLLCVDPPEDVLIDSLTTGGKIDIAEARKRIHHPVESGIDLLAKRADYVTRGNSILESEEHAARGIFALVEPGIVPESIQEKISGGKLSQHAKRKRKKELLRSHALSRGRRAVFALFSQEGGCIPQAKVSKLLGVSEEEVERLSRQGDLLAIARPGAETEFPIWQFSQGKILHGLKRVITALSDHNDLAKLRFFLAGNLHLSGRSPLDALRAGDLEDVIRAAHCYLRQGAA
jgi:hypothetical protein